ncbi:MAG: mannose-1-phosphate guanylyltransferase/mannose-6-phosphate isomerase [Acidimicrobiia bacterium]
MIVPVVLSGGSGTRLWPLSRPQQPKQLLAMTDERTMLRATFDRLAGIEHVTDPLVVCNREHHDLVWRELEGAGMDPRRVVLEPVGRNTAPAVAAAAALLIEDGTDPTLLVLPADHVIEDEAAFRTAVEVGAGHAANAKLVAFGIVPSHPETGFGYIRTGSAIGDTARTIARFVEKPDLETAREYLASGEYLWNSGMFMFGARRYLDELRRFQPDMTNAVHDAVIKADRSEGIHLETESFARSPGDSVDYAVMEHTADGAVISLDAGWSDVGSWAALWEIAAKDGRQNVVVGDVALIDSKRSYLRAESRLVAAIGLEDIIVVETADAVLVVPRDRAQDVKQVVDDLKSHARDEASRHTKRSTAYGSIEDLDHAAGSGVSNVTVRPGASMRPDPDGNALRLVVISGAGGVVVDGVASNVGPGDVVHADPGTAVVVTNTAAEPLRIVAIQFAAPSADDRGENP